jgi:hypothetical protein
MKTKGRVKSNNIEDRRSYGKTKKDSGKVIEKIIIKSDVLNLSLPKYSKRKKKNLAANTSAKKRMSKAR